MVIGGILPYCLEKSYSHPIALLQGKFPNIPKVASGNFLHQKNKNITTRHEMVFHLTGQIKVSEMRSTAAVPLCQYCMILTSLTISSVMVGQFS